MAVSVNLNYKYIDRNFLCICILFNYLRTLAGATILLRYFFLEFNHMHKFYFGIHMLVSYANGTLT